MPEFGRLWEVNHSPRRCAMRDGQCADMPCEVGQDLHCGTAFHAHDSRAAVVPRSQRRRRGACLPGARGVSPGCALRTRLSDPNGFARCLGSRSDRSPPRLCAKGNVRPRRAQRIEPLAACICRARSDRSLRLRGASLRYVRCGPRYLAAMLSRGAPTDMCHCTHFQSPLTLIAVPLPKK